MYNNLDSNTRTLTILAPPPPPPTYSSLFYLTLYTRRRTMDTATPPSPYISTRKRKRCPLDLPQQLPRLPPSPRSTPLSRNSDTQYACLTQDEPLSFEAKSALTPLDASALFVRRQSPVSTPDNAYRYYDAEFGRKVCSAYERHMRTARFVQGLREHKYGPDIAVQYERGYTPEEAREEYESKQEEGLRAWREDMTDDDETVQSLAQMAPKANQAECTATYIEKESAVECKKEAQEEEQREDTGDRNEGAHEGH
ncbi:hypothetical protein LTR50_007349 [Elasticomyces elasticus]|nr:hypothetical protein LTR50_007349 [Elasticomyces elasticus]